MLGILWIFIRNSFHKAQNILCKADFITWDDFDELLILATLEIKESTVECYHSSNAVGREAFEGLRFLASLPRAGCRARENATFQSAPFPSV